MLASLSSARKELAPVPEWQGRVLEQWFKTRSPAVRLAIVTILADLLTMENTYLELQREGGDPDVEQNDLPF